ncbi:MAG: protein-glutamate O-methyltransferase CheR [Bacteriovoracaceae bacterium]|nr:protein-glutamate O-methyltransferase CheR [Bacteriovoracaceae bacterium]
MQTSDEIYKFFSDYIFEHTGIEYKEHDYYRLDSRITTLIKNFEVQNSQELYEICKAKIDPTLQNLLIDLFTNNETYFMRDLKPFKALARSVIPKLKKENSSIDKLNIWCCASSTGQEIYSVKMAVDAFGQEEYKDSFKINASDISVEALERAKRAIYTGLEVQRGLPAQFLIKYFEKMEKEKTWSIKKTLKENTNFFYFNLLHDEFPREMYNIILCRNVLIYQSQKNKKKIIKNLYKALKPGGYLLFGAGESMIGMDSKFKTMEIEKTWFYQKDLAA